MSIKEETKDLNSLAQKKWSNWTSFYNSKWWNSCSERNKNGLFSYTVDYNETEKIYYLKWVYKLENFTSSRQISIHSDVRSTIDNYRKREEPVSLSSVPRQAVTLWPHKMSLGGTITKRLFGKVRCHFKGWSYYELASSFPWL